MDQFISINLVINKENRAYQFIVQPGWEWVEIQSVLDELKVEVENMKQAAIKVVDEEKSAESNSPQS